MQSDLLTVAAVFGTVVFGIWGIFAWRQPDPSPPVAKPHAAPPQQPGFITGLGLVVAFLFLLGWLQPGMLGLNPRALFEESRVGITRSDIRDVLGDMESRVPQVLRDTESRLPQVTADIEREMLKNAHKYGLSASDIRAQMNDLERQSREQIRGMDDDVRREIRAMEEPIWNDLRRIERGY